VTLYKKITVGWVGAKILCIKVRVVQRSIFLSSYGEWALN